MRHRLFALVIMFFLLGSVSAKADTLYQVNVGGGYSSWQTPGYGSPSGYFGTTNIYNGYTSGEYVSGVPYDNTYRSQCSSGNCYSCDNCNSNCSSGSCW